jgi:hypothetical protein
MARYGTYNYGMHSNVLSSKFLSPPQEQRIQSELEGSPRFSPWGVTSWDSFEGYRWTTVVAGKVPDAVLTRESDHAAVLVLPRYSNLVFVNESAMAFTCTNDGIPAIYIVRRSQMDQLLEPIQLKLLEGSTFFPSLNRHEINIELAGIQELLVGHYFIEGQHFIWVLNTRTGVFDHNPVSWFNDLNPDLGYESIELVKVDPKTKMLIGAGAHIPNFVMTADASTLLTFVRDYRNDEIDPVSIRLVEKWTDRLQKQTPIYLG